jgi:hypothetical protein
MQRTEAWAHPQVTGDFRFADRGAMLLPDFRSIDRGCRSLRQHFPFDVTTGVTWMNTSAAPFRILLKTHSTGTVVNASVRSKLSAPIRGNRL